MRIALWVGLGLMFQALPAVSGLRTGLRALPPAATALLQSEGFGEPESKSLVEGREVLSRARLAELPGGRSKRYSVKSAMVVHAGLKTTRDWMSRFDRFAGLVPYVQRSDWDAASGRLRLEGGIWNYFLRATLRFTEVSPERWEFEVVEGHFLGMRGFMQFETAGPGRTLVIFGASLDGARFPPKWLIERGAEIVFAVTGRRVRSSIEAPEPEASKSEASKKDHDHGRPEAQTEIPQPSRRLRAR